MFIGPHLTQNQIAYKGVNRTHRILIFSVESRIIRIRLFTYKRVFYQKTLLLQNRKISNDHHWNGHDYKKFASIIVDYTKKILYSENTFEPTDHVMDLGCGDGCVTASVAQKVPHGKVVGIDFSPDMIKVAKETYSPNHFPNLEFRVGDIRHLPTDLQLQQFHKIISSFCLHWISDHHHVLCQVQRALQPGGYFWCFFPCKLPNYFNKATHEVNFSTKWKNYLKDYDGNILWILDGLPQRVFNLKGEIDAKEWKKKIF